MWTRYWSHGAMHSCNTSYDQNYRGAIESFWRTGFERLAPGSRVLDIGTGNGPLPRLLLSLESRPDLSCEAIDLAEIAPPWLLQVPVSARDRVRFHGACAAECTPFEDASFDLVVSQWGLEYSELKVSVPEVLRVLAPGGAVALLLHHVEALPVALAAHEIGHLLWLMEGASFLDAADAMLAPMALAGTAQGLEQLANNQGAHRARDQFNALQDALQSRIVQGRCTDVLAEVRQAVGTLLGLAARQGEGPARVALQDLTVGLQDALLRLQELRKHALDEPSVRVLATDLAAGAPYQLDVVRDQGAVMAWSLTVTPGRG